MGLTAGGLAARTAGGHASVVSPIKDDGGIVYVALHCQGAPNTARCSGKLAVPQLDESVTGFTLAPGATITFQRFIPGPLHAKIAKLKALKVTLRQVVDGQEQTSTRSYRMVYSPNGRNSGPAAAPSDAPTIGPGPATQYTVVLDPRGDARSSFPLPQLFDIVRATTRRRGNAVVLSVVSTAPITMHDSYGNPVAPCVEIPWASPAQGAMFLFGNGQLAGYTQHYWPKMKTSIDGTTISWTLPRPILAAKGFAKGFLWRATGGCDVHHVADVAPDKGFAIFRWVNVA